MDIKKLNEEIKDILIEEEVISDSKTINGIPFKQIKLNTVTINFHGLDLEYDVIKTVYDIPEGQERRFSESDKTKLIMTTDSKNKLESLDNIILDEMKKQLPEFEIRGSGEHKMIGFPLSMDIKE